MQSKVTLTVYNLLGQEVEKLINNSLMDARYYEMQWNASHQATGMYVAVITMETISGEKKAVRFTKKMLLLK